MHDIRRRYIIDSISIRYQISYQLSKTYRHTDIQTDIYYYGNYIFIYNNNNNNN